MRKILTLLIYFCFSTYASAFPASYLVRSLIGDPNLHFAAAGHALEVPRNFNKTTPGSNAYIGGGKARTSDDYPGTRGSTYSNSYSQSSSHSQGSSDSGGWSSLIGIVAYVIGGSIGLLFLSILAPYWLFKLAQNMFYRRTRDIPWRR
jgi:hypothetical protein